MPHPYFDHPTYRWAWPEAKQLYKALRLVQQKHAIDLLYRQSADELPSLNLDQGPDWVWKEALDHLAMHGALRTFCELCAQHDSPAISNAAQAMLAAESASDPPARRRPSQQDGDEDGAPAVVLNLHERHLQILGDALSRIVPSIFRNSRIRVERLGAARTALLSVDPLIAALSAVAEAETRQPRRHELQQLHHDLQKHRKAVAATLSALGQIRSERGARQLCDDLSTGAAALLAAGARALHHVT